jgi:large subunit ribosomal protein L32
MALPSHKRPKSEKRNRRAANRLQKVAHIKCANCSRPIRSHQVCPVCGIYRGKEFIKKKKTAVKKEEDKKQKK